MRRLPNHTLVVAGMLSLGIAGCDLGKVEKISLDPCKARPTALAHVSGILTSPMTMDELNLYVVSSEEIDGSPTQSIWRVPKDGSPPQRVVTSRTRIAGMCLRGHPQESTVLWTTVGPSEADGGPVGSVKSIALGSNQPPVTIAANRHSPTDVTTDGDHVYWAEQEVASSGQTVEAIVEAPVTGGAVTRVQAFDAGEVPQDLLWTAYWSAALDASVGVLFWSTWNFEHGSERSSEIAASQVSPSVGPRVVVVGPDGGGTAGTQRDFYSSTIFYSGPRGITEYLFPVDGGPGASRTVVDTDGFVDRITDDFTYVYFVDRTTGRLMAASRSGPDTAVPRVVVDRVDPASAIQVDEACVYWIDPDTQSLVMVTK